MKENMSHLSKIRIKYSRKKKRLFEKFHLSQTFKVILKRATKVLLKQQVKLMASKQNIRIHSIAKVHKDPKKLYLNQGRRKMRLPL